MKEKTTNESYHTHSINSFCTLSGHSCGYYDSYFLLTNVYCI